MVGDDIAAANGSTIVISSVSAITAEMIRRIPTTLQRGYTRVCDTGKQRPPAALRHVGLVRQLAHNSRAII